MEPAEREQFDQQVRARAAAGEHDRAAELVIRGYGPEILRYLAAQHRQEEDADEVFSIWSERVYRALGAFAWDCSLRTWAYVVARNASRNFHRDAGRKRRREVPLDAPAGDGDGDGGIQLAAADVRTATRPYLRTEVKDKLAAIRDALPEEDRALLVLRVDRDLAWTDLARIMLEDQGNAQATDEVLKRESARLRKRFQFVKQRILELGRESGLLGGDDDGEGHR